MCLLAYSNCSALYRKRQRRHKGKISYSGDELSSGDSAIVISNHRSFSDFYMLHSIAVRRNMLPHLKYFAKDSLKLVRDGYDYIKTRLGFFDMMLTLPIQFLDSVLWMGDVGES